MNGCSVWPLHDCLGGPSPRQVMIFRGSANTDDSHSHVVQYFVELNIMNTISGVYRGTKVKCKIVSFTVVIILLMLIVH